MLTKRIIPCLDVKDGMTVKGINFENIKVVGDAVKLGSEYAMQGADELIFLDITATNDKRKTMSDLAAKVARAIDIPFTIGGGISSVQDVDLLLKYGADKISINSAAVLNPGLISDIAKVFGSQCVVVAIDTKRIDKENIVFISGGKKQTALKTLEWAKECEDRGAGEILLTSMDHDGTKQGFALDITAMVSQSLKVPIIASGGAGTKEHFKEVLSNDVADAALAASLFHYGILPIPELKAYLKQEQISIR
jgi:imidazole glycerol-phosphate synthase subunit HisF